MALLEVNDLVSGYGSLEVLHGISLDVAEGEIVSVLGANGAGKTTFLRAVSGVLDTWSGSVRLAGDDLAGMSVERRAGAGELRQQGRRRDGVEPVAEQAGDLREPQQAKRSIGAQQLPVAAGPGPTRHAAILTAASNSRRMGEKRHG